MSAEVAAIPAGWDPATEVTVTTGASTDAEVLDVRTVYYLFWLPDTKGSGHSCHIRWGDASVEAATLSDLPLTEEHPFRVVETSRDYHAFRAIAGGGQGSLFVASSTR